MKQKDTKGSTQKVKECIYLNVLQHKSTNFFSKKILLVLQAPFISYSVCVRTYTPGSAVQKMGISYSWPHGLLILKSYSRGTGRRNHLPSF